MKTKIIIIILVLIASVTLIGSYLNTVEQASTVTPVKNSPGISDILVKTTFTETVTSWEKQGITVSLPSWMPEGYKPTVVYTKIQDGKVGNFGEFLYSKSGIDKLETAELVIEVRLGDVFPFDKNTTKVGKFVKINGYDAFIYDEAPVNYDEYIALYGKTSRLVDVQVGSVNYWFRGAPSISMDEMMKIASSITP